MKKTLIFVYNANSGGVHKTIDMMHKIISPSTYVCSLCSITHGNLYEKKAWKQYREQTPHEFVFMYKDVFIIKYGATWETKEFPMILASDMDGGLHPMMTATEFKQIQTIPELITRLDTYLLQ